MTQRDASDAPQHGEATATEAIQRLRDYAGLISGLLHELRTPLGSIVGAASVLEQYSENLDAPAKARICVGIIEQARRLDCLFTALAAVARARTGTLVGERQTVELNELLRGLWTSSYSRRGAPGRISLLREEVLLETNPEVIRTVVSSMLGVALLFSPDDDDLSLALARKSGHAEITVESGVREEERARLDKLARGSRSGALPQAGDKADAICLAAIGEVVHILGGTYKVQQFDAAGRLCQTVRF